MGVPSDHRGILVKPVSTINSIRKTNMKKCTVMPLPKSQIEKLGGWVTTENWDSLLPDMSSTELVESFEKSTSQKVIKYFPQKKTVTITAYDKPYITQELKMLRRQRQRKYRQEGKSKK